MSDYEIKVDGKENTFGDGAIRYSKNKGRFDLIPGVVLYNVLDNLENTDKISISPMNLMKALYTDDYSDAIINLTYLKYGMVDTGADPIIDPFTNVTITRDEFMRYFIMMLKDLAIHFQKGAEKYGERNCEKGIPLWSFNDSAIRHTCQFLLGEIDEPHHISAIWNCWMGLWTIMLK